MLCVDNFFTGSRCNVERLLDSKRFEILRHDVTFPLYVEVDEIYNLACPASPVHYQFDPVQTTKTSVLGAVKMLGLAKRLKVPILQASTSEVYGDPAIHPQVESYWGNVNPVGPRSCYDEGKRCAETLFFDYRRQHDVAIKGHPHLQHLRPAHASRRRPGGLQLHRPGAHRRGHHHLRRRQTRSFCYVDDLVRGMMAMMDAPAALSGPVNLGNPNELTGSRSRIVHAPLPQDDPRQRQPDIGQARERLGWSPDVPLREGLGRTIAYFEDALAAA